MLIAAVQAQQELIEKQGATIEALRAEIEVLKGKE